MNIEKIRRDITLLAKAIENHDEIVSNSVEARWRHDMIVEVPDLGAAKGPDGRPVMILPADMKVNLDGLESQRAAAEIVLLKLTGTNTLEAARQRYLDVVTVFNRVGSLLELERTVATGYGKALDEARKEIGQQDASVARAVDALVSLRRDAEAMLTDIAAELATDISAIERINAGIILPS